MVLIKDLTFYRRDDGVEYYIYEGVHYDAGFDMRWAISHAAGTGPLDCENCMEYSFQEGLFMGYCVNCAQYPYYNTRGRGYVAVGVQFGEDDDASTVFDENDLSTVFDENFIEEEEVLIPTDLLNDITNEDMYGITNEDMYGITNEDMYGITNEDMYGRGLEINDMWSSSLCECGYMDF